jgi:phosphoribosylformimino-5-aminoimidazole carboxamide ribotide isomerase
VATGGWLEMSSRGVIELARELERLPLAGLLYTDIERDGTEVGPNVGATLALAEQVSLPVIASGGVGTLAHLEQLALASRASGGRITGAIVGRALHEGRFDLVTAQRHLQALS